MALLDQDAPPGGALPWPVTLTPAPPTGAAHGRLPLRSQLPAPRGAAQPEHTHARRPAAQQHQQARNRQHTEPSTSAPSWRTVPPRPRSFNTGPPASRALTRRYAIELRSTLDTDDPVLRRQGRGRRAATEPVRDLNLDLVDSLSQEDICGEAAGTSDPTSSSSGRVTS